MERGRETQRERRRRTGGRSARVVTEVLEATIDVLARVGYEALTMDAVAAAARVSRTTVYRRWASKRALVRASILRVCEARVAAVRDTGTLRADLRELVAALVPADPAALRRSAAVLSVLTAGCGDPELAALLQVARERLRQPLFAVVERAVARGELPPGSDPALVIEPVLATVHLRRAMAGDASAAFAERLVELVVAGARALGAGS
jgi:AcrR family transcriptional regulator